jgi:salicylate hydroxylase
VEECETYGVEIRLKSEVHDINFEQTTVTLKDADVFSGDVIIGADGNNEQSAVIAAFQNHLLISSAGLWSTLRTRTLGYSSPPQETGDLAFRGTFSLEALQALKDPAIDELCQKCLVTMWIGPEGHSVFYPVRCGLEFNLVMTRPDDLPASIRSKEGDLEEMKAVFEGWDPV